MGGKAGCSKQKEATTLSLDDPKQWSMGWTLLPEVYGNAKNDLDFWASTVDVTQPDRATEEFWPTIAQYGIALNAILPRKITTDGELEALRQIFGDLNSTANPAMSFVANFPPCLQDATIPKPTDTFDNKALYAYMPKTGTIAGMINFLFTFAFSPPYEPLVPLTGIDSDLYLEDPACNQALIGYRQSIIDAVEAIQPETPQIYQWPLNIET